MQERDSVVGKTTDGSRENEGTKSPPVAKNPAFLQSPLHFIKTGSPLFPSQAIMPAFLLGTHTVKSSTLTWEGKAPFPLTSAHITEPRREGTLFTCRVPKKTVYVPLEFRFREKKSCRDPPNKPRGLRGNLIMSISLGKSKGPGFPSYKAAQEKALLHAPAFHRPRSCFLSHARWSVVSRLLLPVFQGR